VKPDCILHIGHTKTGSTSIQNVCGTERAALQAAGICYPKSPGWSNHALLPASSAVPALQDRGVHPAFWGGLPPAERIARFLADDFPAEMSALPAGTRLVLFSSEQCIHMLPDPASVARLRDLIAPHVGQIRVVVYLRRQDEHVASAYTQMLRDGVIARPGLPEGGPKQLFMYDYAGLMARWSEVFGQAAMVPRLFGRDTLVQGDAIDDLLTLAGAPGLIPPDHPQRESNPSADAQGQAVMVGAAAAMPGIGQAASLADPVWRHLMELITEARPGRGWRPAPAAARAFMDRFAEGNEWIRATWFPERPFLFPPVADGAAGPTPFPEGDALAGPALDMLARVAALALRAHVAQLVEGARLEAHHGNPAGATRMLMRAIAADEAAPLPRLRLAALLIRDRKLVPAAQHLAVASARLPADDAELGRVRAMLARAQATPRGPAIRAKG
jgi:hypothetical protein